MNSRYERQRMLLGDEAQQRLENARVLILGCGGLGGYLLEYIVRIGVGSVTIVDGDVFSESNLNRQLLSMPNLIGIPKVIAAEARANLINPKIKTYAVQEWLTAENADSLLAGHDLVLDALDNIPARLVMEDACTRLGIPIIHGAIDGWCAQIATVPPGSGMLHRLYGSMLTPPDTQTPSLSCTPALCAALQGAEAVKLLTGQEPSLESRLLVFDLQTMTCETLSV